jgi:hypothetical protein
MCLEQLNQSCKPKLKKEHGHYVGWKIYRMYDIKTQLLTPVWQGKRQVIGTWMNEKEYRFSVDKHIEMIQSLDNYNYLRGFHIYLEPQPYSESFYNRKVYFDHIVANGLQGLEPVVVAKKMKILRQRKVK